MLGSVSLRNVHYSLSNHTVALHAVRLASRLMEHFSLCIKPACSSRLTTHFVDELNSHRSSAIVRRSSEFGPSGRPLLANISHSNAAPACQPASKVARLSNPSSRRLSPVQAIGKARWPFLLSPSFKGGTSVRVACNKPQGIVSWNRSQQHVRRRGSLNVLFTLSAASSPLVAPYNMSDR